MIPVAEASGKRPDPAACRNEHLVIGLGHVRGVRLQRTSVNDVDNVQAFSDYMQMSKQTTGEALRGLRKRAGISLEKVAERAGYKGRSGVQTFFNPEYSKPLDTDVAAKLSEALEGLGDPQILRSEIYALTGAPEGQAVVHFEGASMERMRQDVPILGTAMGADRIVNDYAVEQTYLYTDEVVGYAKRPVILDGRADVYAVYVQGSSMDPAFEDGDLAFVEAKRPARIGDNVVVYLRKNGGDHEQDDGESARAVLIKKLISKRASHLEFEQYNPRATFSIDAKEILKMHRVMTLSDLLS